MPAKKNTTRASTTRKPSKATQAKASTVPPLEHARRALMTSVAPALASAFSAARGDDARLIAAAEGVTLFLSTALEPTATPEHRTRLYAMAREAELYALHINGESKEWRWAPYRKSSRADAERSLLARLPRTARDARGDFSFEAGEDRGAENLAGWLLLVLGSADHDDAKALRQRWALSDMRMCLSSVAFIRDRDEIAGDVLAAIHDDEQPAPGETFAHLLLRRAYKIVGLGRPFRASQRTKQRKRKALEAS